MFHSYAQVIGVVDDADKSREKSTQIGKLLNSGGYGQVFQGTYNGNICAVKKIKHGRRKTNKGMTRKQVTDEIKYIQMLHHPNILRLFDAFLLADGKTFYVITELCAGGDAFDAHEAGVFTEIADIMKVTRDVLSAIDYMHGQKIMHRDIKPENIMLKYAGTGEEPISIAKVIDFGLATTFENGQRFHQAIGTPHYMAPEVFANNYRETCDEWSIGVFVFTLIEAAWPFGGPDTPTRQLIRTINTKTNIFENTEFHWDAFPNAKNFVSRLLDKNGETRMTARQALDHPFITQIASANAKRMDNKIASFRLRQFIHINKIKRLIRYKIAQELSLSDKKRYEKEFGQGLAKMSRDQARGKMREYHFTDEEIDQVFQHLDVSNNNSWDISEFIAGVMSQELYNTISAFEKAFASIDTNQNKRLDRDEIVEVVGETDADEIISEFGDEPITLQSLEMYFKSTMDKYVEPSNTIPVIRPIEESTGPDASQSQLCSIQ